MGDGLMDNQSISNTTLKVFHQNIRGLRNKLDKLYCHLSHDIPHIICMSEYHLRDFELQLTYLSDYTLAAIYCRTFFKKGGVSIFVRSKLKYNPINLEGFTTDKDIGACAIHMLLNSLGEKKFCILTIYRSPSGNFTNFWRD
jgi:hypothetical protein